MTKIDSRVIDLYNTYIHTSLSRQEFLARAMHIVGVAGAATAPTGLALYPVPMSR